MDKFDVMDLLWDAKEALKDLEDYSYRVLDERISAIEKTLLLKDDLAMLDEGVAENRPAPKPIDWSKVSPIVPVTVWDDGDRRDQCFLYPKLGSGRFLASDWDHASLITGIDIAWHGGECPLPGGVVTQVTTRNGSVYQKDDARSLSWKHRDVYAGSPFDIISFRVTDIHPDWTEEVRE